MARYERHHPDKWEVGATYELVHPIGAVIERYFYEILTLRDAFGKAATIFDLEAEQQQADWLKFLATFDESGEKAERRKERRRLPFDAPPVKQPEYLEMLKRHLQSSHMADAARQMMLLGLVAHYDAFLTHLMRGVFELQPSLLRRSERAMSWAELADLADKEEIGSLFMEREVESLVRKGHIDQLQDLEGRLDFDTLRKFDELSEFVEVMERRNLVAHNGGKVSIQYVRQCERYKARPGGVPGDQLEVDQDYFFGASECLLVVGIKLAYTVWRKIVGKNKPDLEVVDSHLSQVIYMLLAAEDWRLAQRLLKFAVNLGNYGSEQRKLVFMVNYAQTYKWLGDQGGCEEVLAPIEWESKDIAFQISHAVLLDDYDSAGELMSTAARTGQVARTALDHWPVYRAFRRTKQFADAYRAAYEEEPVAMRSSAALDKVSKR